MEITNRKENPQTKQTFVTISERYGSEHIILRLGKSLDIKKADYQDNEVGIKSHFVIFKK